MDILQIAGVFMYCHQTSRQSRAANVDDNSFDMRKNLECLGIIVTITITLPWQRENPC